MKRLRGERIIMEQVYHSFSRRINLSIWEVSFTTMQRALEKFERVLNGQDRSRLIEQRKELKELLDSL